MTRSKPKRRPPRQFALSVYQPSNYSWYDGKQTNYVSPHSHRMLPRTNLFDSKESPGRLSYIPQEWNHQPEGKCVSRLVALKYASFLQLYIDTRRLLYCNQFEVR